MTPFILSVIYRYTVTEATYYNIYYNLIKFVLIIMKVSPNMKLKKFEQMQAIV